MKVDLKELQRLSPVNDDVKYTLTGLAEDGQIEISKVFTFLGPVVALSALRLIENGRDHQRQIAHDLLDHAIQTKFRDTRVFTKAEAEGYLVDLFDGTSPLGLDTAVIRAVNMGPKENCWIAVALLDFQRGHYEGVARAADRGMPLDISGIVQSAIDEIDPALDECGPS